MKRTTKRSGIGRQADSPVLYRKVRVERSRLQALLFLLAALVVLAAFDPPAVAAEEPLQVEVRGVEGEALKNLQAALKPPSGLVREGRVDRRWIERLVHLAPRRAASALKPFGYYHAEVDAALEEVVAGRSYRLVVEVRPGTPVRLDQVTVSVSGPGGGRKQLQELAREFPMKKGDVLRQDLYEQAKGKLKSRAVELGYLDADFTVHRIEIDLTRDLAAIELVLETGGQYRFGEVLIHGAPDYPDPFLRRYLAISEGEDFSYAKLGETQLNYLNSDRFRDVIVTPRPELARDMTVPVGIQLVPSKRRRLRPGIGYGTDTGARVTLRYKDVNIFHQGHEFTAEANIAQRRQSLLGEYIIPSKRHLNQQTALRGGYDQESINTYESRTIYAEVEHVHALASGRLASAFLRLIREDFTIGEQDSSSFLVLPGVRFSQRRYDDPVRPRKGHQYRLELRGTHQSLGSDTGLLQALASANLLQPLPGRFSIFARAQAGATWQNEPLRELPPSLRFFAGGDKSVRGYGYQSLGPRDSSGDVVGGKNLLVGSVEVERALGENWGLAVFYDAGNAFDSFNDYEIFQGAGFGVRRYTPVGPVKVDLARQIGVPDPSYRFHVSIGFAW